MIIHLTVYHLETVLKMFSRGNTSACALSLANVDSPSSLDLELHDVGTVVATGQEVVSIFW